MQGEKSESRDELCNYKICRRVGKEHKGGWVPFHSGWAVRQAGEASVSGSWLWNSRRAIIECLIQNAWSDSIRELLA